MAKRKREVSQSSQKVYATEQIDDSLLPTPNELADYKTVDPTLTEYLKETASKEQSHRHSMDNGYLSLNKREQWLQHGIRYFALIIAALLSAGMILVSYKLLMAEKLVSGSILGTAALIFLFTSIVNPKQGKQN